jgi:hypothetical protein
MQINAMQIAIALVWEFWARGWRAILGAQTGAVAFMCLIFGTTAAEGVIFRATDAGRAMQFGFYWFTLIVIGSSVLTALGNPVRRYTLPASSLMLVGWPMACGMVTTFVLYASTAVILNTVFDAGWTVVGPGLQAAFLFALFQAILWSTSGSLFFQGLACLGSFWIVVVVAARTRMRMLEDFNALQLLLFVLATIVCLSVGTVGFARRRRGSAFEWEQFVGWLNWRRWSATRSAAFRSPASAQFWLEFSDRGYSLPVGTSLIGIVVLSVAVFWPPPDPRAFVEGISFCLAALACVVGIFLGLRSEHGEFGNFNGSRPLTDSQIATAVLKSATFGLISAAVIWTAVVTATLWILGERVESWPVLQKNWQLASAELISKMAIGAVTVWSAVGLVTSACLAGKRVMAATFFLPLGLALVGIVTPKYVIPVEIRGWFMQWYFDSCLGLAVLLGLATFVASSTLRLISWQTLFLAAGIAALTIVAAQFLLGWEKSLPLEVICGCCMLPVPLAAAPLAVWWNRHR